MNILWFKRDLRLHDHEPLTKAIECNSPLMLLYIFEPSVMSLSAYDIRHWRFVWESLQDLNLELQKHNTIVHIMQGEVVPILKKLHQTFSVKNIFSHEETGLKIIHEHEKAVAKFCSENNITWHEYKPNGVIKVSKNCDNWVKNWYSTMKLPQHQPNWEKFTPYNCDLEFINQFPLDLFPTITLPDPNFQHGGEKSAWSWLNSYLEERASNTEKIDTKSEAIQSYSNSLSPYISWGNLSVRQIFQAQSPTTKKSKFMFSLNSFAARLRWHCNFINRFEKKFRIDFENSNFGFISIHRKRTCKKFDAWKNGHTGYPFIDAVMRNLKETGNTSFKMRAMVMSFLTHQLALDWKEGAEWLAKLFLDFDPRIHYAQAQMQASLSDSNIFRIYNPIKLSKNYDPEGIFIKKWVPELENLPPHLVHEPWKITSQEQSLYNFTIDVTYPSPIIELSKIVNVELKANEEELVKK